MNTVKKTAAGTVLGGALLVSGGLGLAHAAPSAPQAVTADGSVDVAVTANGQQIGTIPNVTLSNAVALASSVCPTAGIDLPALTNLDNTGTSIAQPCNGMSGLSFSFAQNAGGQGAGGQGAERQGAEGQGAENGNGGSSGYAPGQNKAPSAATPSATPSTPPGQQGR